jgi:hypothetical protein
MNRSPLLYLSALTVCLLLLPALPAHAATSSLPALGTPVPTSLLRHVKHCRTHGDQRDPCTEIQVDHVKYTVAWNDQTKAVTYLFTNDRRLVTGTGLSVGGTCRVTGDSGQTDPTVSYLKWFIDPKWKGKDTSAGSKGIWYAALQKDGMDASYGDIVGFVQSSYLKLNK